MALSDRQIQCVVFELGWPSKTVDVGSTHYSKIFTDRITTLSAQGEIKVDQLLCRMTSIREQIDDAQCRLTTLEVDKLKLNDREISRLWKLHSRYVKELSDFLDLPIMRSASNVVSLVI